MKPIYLEMSAFGSYGKKEVIDFANVDRGIFLITGDTGAGKTTIFDAITYALYDKTSGGKRDGEMMRSQYAKEDTRTYVRFRFQYNGEEYEVLRSPRQERMSRKKNAKGEYTTIIEQPGVDLFLPDGVQFHGKIRDTNRKIEEIIGLDIDQFTQIAMIAQGDFLKLLQASSKERKEIFQKIFDTRIYWLMEQELANRMKKVWVTLSDNRKNIEREIARVVPSEDSEYTEAWAQMGSFTELKSIELIELLERIVQEQRDKEKECKGVLDEKGKELQSLALKIQETEATNEAFALLAKSENQMLQLTEQAPDYKQWIRSLERGRRALHVQHAEEIYENKKKEYQELCQQQGDNQNWIHQEQQQVQELEEDLREYLETSQRELDRLNLQSRELATTLPQYQEYDQLKQTIAREKVQLQKQRKHIEELIKHYQTDKEHLEEQRAWREQLQKDLEEEGEKKEQLRLLEEKTRGLQAMAELYGEYQKLEADYQKKNQEYLEQERAYEEARENYQKLFREFLGGQALILGEMLTEGEPCPVCGSTHHPAPAHHQKTTISREQLDRQEKHNRELEDNWKKSMDNRSRADRKLNSQKQILLREGQRILNPEFAVDDLKDRDLEKEARTEEEKAQAARKACVQIAAKREQYQANGRKIIELQESIKQVDHVIDQENTLLQQGQITYEKNATREEEIHKRLALGSEAEAKKQIQILDTQIQTRKAERDTRISQIQTRKDTLRERQGQLLQQTETASRLQEETNTCEENFKQERKNQKFRGQEEYRSSIRREKELKELQEQCEKYQTDTAKCKERIQLLKKQLKGKEIVDVRLLKEEEKEKKRERSDLERENKELYGMLTINRGVHQNLLKEYENRKKTEEQYKLLKGLSDTANGKLNGYHMNFQTFIQRKYFKKIIQEANKRLRSMSREQFILQCKDMDRLSKMGEAGLDLDVYSALTDKTRDVKTLSGGESFMAALAMALGMSDMIQRQAGRIQIDTMFIDEGFGTLSDEVRNQAIQILQELSGDNRLIGIISHVSELKTQIDRKLVVTKTAKGSSVNWEL